MKKLISFSLFISMIFIFSTVSFANEKNFSDLDKNHWAHNSIMEMVDRGIIEGYEDGSFKPNRPITREQFAKILVLSLDLPLETPNQSTFDDVKKDDWSYPYIETSKNYLTGYESGEKLLYKPKNRAVREDMAVAIIFAKGLQNQDPDLSVLDSYKDKVKMSNELKKYIAIAINNKIMEGYNNGLFKPQGTLTRAEACELIYKSGIITKENKIVIGEKSLKSPIAKPASGKYNTPIKINFTNNYSENTKIYYTLDGTEPNLAKYSSSEKANDTKKWNGEPIKIDKTSILRAVAVKFKNSNIVTKSPISTYKYTIKNAITLNSPKATPKEGTYYKPIEVTFTNDYNDNTKIYYTLDGTKIRPLIDDIKNNLNLSKLDSYIKKWDGEPIKINKSTKLKAIAVEVGDFDEFSISSIQNLINISPVSKYKYTIKNETLQNPPKTTHKEGIYYEPINIKFTNDYGQNIKIYYTLDGSTPLVSWPQPDPEEDFYPEKPSPELLQKTKLWNGEPIKIDKTTTLKAVATYGKRPVTKENTSEIATYKYTIDDKISLGPPKVTPKEGTYHEPIEVTFTNNYNDNTKIYYTLDDIDIRPLIEDVKNNFDFSKLNSYIKTWDGEPIKIDKTTTLKAIAVEIGSFNEFSLSSIENLINISPISKYKYTIENK